ncbi:MAG TPA: sulfur carrier protein ThiS [Chloroflexota bacterium]|nr:sulfur carrier protein ThiS [Chloroflexota bacterium]
MRLIVNREPLELDLSQPDVRSFVLSRGLQENQIAVAVNGEVVPRATWSGVRLADGDQVELVRAVGGGSELDDEPLVIAGREFRSRLFLGSGKYATGQDMEAALEASGTQMVTVAIRYMNLDGSSANGGVDILSHLDLQRYWLLPNTAGAYSVKDAVRMAQLAREACNTNWIKLEVIGDAATLWPDVAGTVEATRILKDEGFVVMAYTAPDLVTACKLEEAGADAVMPLASLIGSGRGFQDYASVRLIVQRLSVPVVVDAGIGVPSDAALAMECGASACLINTAIAKAQNPARMAAAMRLGVEAGRQAYLAGRMAVQELAAPSSPTAGVPVATPVGAAIE